MTRVVKRIRAHHDAGADHVAVQVLTEDPTTPRVAQWRELAQASLSRERRHRVAHRNRPR